MPRLIDKDKLITRLQQSVGYQIGAVGITEALMIVNEMEEAELFGTSEQLGDNRET